MHVHTNDVRTLEAVEADIGKVQARLAELHSEQADADGKLSGATDDDALLEAAMSGKSLATTQRVAKLEARSEELGQMIRVLDNRLLRLRLERTDLLLANNEREFHAAGKEVAAAQEAVDDANAALAEAHNRASAFQSERYSLAEQRSQVENALLAADPQYAEDLAEQRREQAEAEATTPEQYRQMRKATAAMSGIHLVDDDEELEALKRAAAAQGVKLTVAGPKGGA
jgi:chromosome segregation ATPase